MPKIELKKSVKQKLLHNRKKSLKEDEKYFISSGSHNLNLALTGDINKGYCRGRIVQIKGQYSTSKSILADEAMNSVYYLEHKLKGKKVKIVHCDAEMAVDKQFMNEMGVPVDFIEFHEPDTIEEFHDIFLNTLAESEDYDLVLIVLDTLDALTDKKEEAEISKALKAAKKKAEKTGEEVDEEKIKGSYGAQMGKYMSQFFRNLKKKIKKSNCIFLLVSQLRDDLKASRYGSGSTSRGGKAAGFYATQIIDLKRKDSLYATAKAKENKMSYGDLIEGKVVKNKVYSKGRKAEFIIVTNPAHGIENYRSIINFCIKHKILKESEGIYKWKGKELKKNKLIEYFTQNEDEFKDLLEMVQETWSELEEAARIEIKPKWKILEEN